MSFEDMTNTQLINRYGGTTWERIQDRYLITAGSNHTVGTTGGSSTVTLTENNLPSHSHTYSRSSTSTGSHTLTISEMPSHSHGQNVSAAVGGSGIRTDYNSDAASSAYPQGIDTGNAGGGGSHYHSITRTSVSSGSTGSGTAFSIEPPYIAIYMWRRTA